MTSCSDHTVEIQSTLDIFSLFQGKQIHDHVNSVTAVRWVIFVLNRTREQAQWLQIQIWKYLSDGTEFTSSLLFCMRHVTVCQWLPKFGLEAYSPEDTMLILMDVEQLGHFIEIRMFLSILNNLQIP